jgi:hypothetical protein
MEFSIARSHRPARAATRLFPNGVKFMGLLGLVLASIPAAQASCGDITGLSAPFEFVDASAQARSIQDDEVARSRGGNTAPTIVGLWKFTVASKGNTSHNPPIPDGAVIDWGYSQWHSDAIEFSNSGPHSPASGNICLGTWESDGARVYNLNHFGLNYDATSGAWTGTVNIHQTVTVSLGGTMYTGTYIIDMYDTKANHIDHVGGQVTAIRLNLDSTVN